jgi:hypothetical protein
MRLHVKEHSKNPHTHEPLACKRNRDREREELLT